MTIDDCQILELPRIQDPRGCLSFLECGNHVPFEIKRVFYIYDLPDGVDRGGHAHHALHQLIICLNGKMSVCLDDGFRQKTVNLDHPWVGLHVPPMIWASEGTFAPGTVYMVLASEHYSPESYLRNYDEFIRTARNHE